MTNEAPADDGELIARAGAGDRAAWRALYLRHRDFVHRVAFRFMGNEADARDVTQDTFIAVFRNASSYRESGKFTTYLWRTVANRCLTEKARAWHRLRDDHAADDEARGLLSLPDERPTPEEALDASRSQARVQAAIASLPERQRLALVLARYEGLSYEDIAETLSCSVSSVESLLFRARQSLLARLR